MAIDRPTAGHGIRIVDPSGAILTEGEIGAILDDEQFLFERVVEIGGDAAALGFLGCDELAGEGFLGDAAAFEGVDAPPVTADGAEEACGPEGEGDPAGLPPMRTQDDFEGGIGDGGHAVVVDRSDAAPYVARLPGRHMAPSLFGAE